MRQAGYVLALFVLAVLAYVHFHEPPPEPPPPPPVRHARLASPGTFYLLSYASLQTPRGIIGFEPGREVQLVSANQEKKLLRVTDGKYQIDLPPSQLTNDLDMAALARNADEASQRKILAFTEQERVAYESAVSKANTAYTEEMDRINRDATAASAISTHTGKLDAPAERTNSYVYPYGYPYYSSYSPYSYFYPSYTRNY